MAENVFSLTPSNKTTEEVQFLPFCFEKNSENLAKLRWNNPFRGRNKRKLDYITCKSKMGDNNQIFALNRNCLSLNENPSEGRAIFALQLTHYASKFGESFSLTVQGWKDFFLAFKTTKCDPKRQQRRCSVAWFVP